MSEELLLEIGTEEIPAAFMPGALANLKSLMEKELSAARVAFDEISTCGTPRRLVLTGRGLAATQEDLVVEKTGPATSIAYDGDGNPTRAAIGFARGQGVGVSELTTVETDKGTYICARRQEIGVATAALLPELLPKVIGALPFPKSMRWKDLDVRFARPIHWIVALFGGTVVEFSYGGVQSGRATRGHRFMAPEAREVQSADDYLRVIRDARVEIDPAVRKKIVEDALAQLGAQAGGATDIDAALLEEVAWIVEYPYPVLGTFEKEYLELPPAVLLTSMKKHQKYFPVLAADGRPLPHFIAVNNTDTVDPAVVVRGHERVLRARLADARFFFAEDRKKGLETMAEALQQVLFQAKLGTSYEKMQRFQKLALAVADDVGTPEIKPAVERAAYLCKADLVSEMVGEFPELQGIMGREYALLAGEPAEVALAIDEHYLPRFAGGGLPASDIGAAVSIADRLDTIVGCFGIGLVPTGTADPYALRRQCLGIINIILSKKYAISLKSLIETSITLLAEKIERPADEIAREVAGFFSGRLTNMLTSQGMPYDAVDAVLALGVDDIADCVARIEALQQMKQDQDFESLAVSFKRVVNILADKKSGSVNETLFEQEEERALYRTVQAVQGDVQQQLGRKEYVAGLKKISTIRGAVDSFFDNVLVMADREEVRLNRLALLNVIKSMFTDFADFSKIATE